MGGIALGLWIVGIALAAPGEVPYPDALDRAAIRLESLSDIVADGLLLGNGDVNALVHADGADLVVRLTKNDVWDARIPTELDPPLPRFADILKLGRPDGPERTAGWPNSGFIIPRGTTYTGPDSYNANAYPCPRACAVVRLPGAAAPPLTATLDLRRAVLTVTSAAGETRLFIDATANRLMVDGAAAKAAQLDPVRSNDLAPPETGSNSGIDWLAQRIPGDADWPGMAFRVACRAGEQRAAVGLSTSLDAGDADALARDGAMADVGAHAVAWAAFWGKSGIQLPDPVLEQAWYRNLYFLRCVSKPGVQAAGLFAGLIDDKPAWHGDYHTNYNIQQTFWGAYASNHDELAEPYARLIREYLPRAQWLCQTLFGWEGAFYPHVLYAYEPPHPDQCSAPNGRQYLHHVWGFTMGVTPFTVQPVWWHYRYVPDRSFLAETAYPLVREAANFCAGFVDNCARKADGTVDFGPSVSPEHWSGWPEGFNRNYDSTFDIGFFRFAFDAATEGAQTLGVDADLVARWAAARALLPDYPVTTGDAPVVVDMREAPPIEYNIPVPATPVFPAGTVDWQSPEATRTLFARTIDTLKTNGNNSAVMLAAARARLGMIDTVPFLRREILARLRPNGTLSLNSLEPHHRFNDFGHYSEQFGVVLPISELLLQSNGGVIRVFPAWPAGEPAAFVDLRAEGGFLVSATHDGQRVTELRIESTVGGDLCLKTPWASFGLVKGEDAVSSNVTAHSGERGEFVVVTAAGDEITLFPQ